MDEFIIDKKWFYNKAKTCPIIRGCIMEHEHNGMSWAAALALMVRHLSEAHDNKMSFISNHMKLCTFIEPILKNDQAPK